MKVEATAIMDGNDRYLVFSIPEKPDAGEIRLKVSDFRDGKQMAKRLKPWAAQHGAEL